uniref:FIIND domain-containing protein n=1 Tax=Hucho hucho TaxID=62062 RepID=A0A4W5P395_9TELE
CVASFLNNVRIRLYIDWLCIPCLVSQAVEQQEKSQGSSRILISRPEQSFKLNSSFRLNIHCSTSINPQKMKLIHRDTTPSFFRAVMKMTGIDIEMELFSDDERIVWKEMVSQGRRICQSSLCTFVPD